MYANMSHPSYALTTCLFIICIVHTMNMQIATCPCIPAQLSWLARASYIEQLTTNRDHTTFGLRMPLNGRSKYMQTKVNMASWCNSWPEQAAISKQMQAFENLCPPKGPICTIDLNDSPDNNKRHSFIAICIVDCRRAFSFREYLRWSLAG